MGTDIKVFLINTYQKLSPQLPFYSKTDVFSNFKFSNFFANTPKIELFFKFLALIAHYLHSNNKQVVGHFAAFGMFKASFVNVLQVCSKCSATYRS